MNPRGCRKRKSESAILFEERCCDRATHRRTSSAVRVLSNALDGLCCGIWLKKVSEAPLVLFPSHPPYKSRIIHVYNLYWARGVLRKKSDQHALVRLKLVNDVHVDERVLRPTPFGPVCKTAITKVLSFLEARSGQPYKRFGKIRIRTIRT